MSENRQETVSLVDQAYELIRDKILRFELLPGEQISDFVLANSIGMSRTPIRAAMTRLNTEGLIATNGRRQYVAEMTVEKLREVFFLREAIECMAVRVLFESGLVTPELIQSLRVLNEQMKSEEVVADYHRFFLLDDQFHLLLVQSTRLDSFVNIIKNNAQLVTRFRWLSAVSSQRFLGSYNEHARIIGAFAQNDMDKAIDMLHDHCTITYKCYESILGRFSPDEWIGLIRAFTRVGK